MAEEKHDYLDFSNVPEILTKYSEYFVTNSGTHNLFDDAVDRLREIGISECKEKFEENDRSVVIVPRTLDLYHSTEDINSLEDYDDDIYYSGDDDGELHHLGIYDEFYFDPDDLKDSQDRLHHDDYIKLRLMYIDE